MPVLAFLMTIALSPVNVMGATAERWAVIAFGLGLLVYRLPRLTWTPAHGLLLMFVCWCALTLAWTDFPRDWVAGFAVLLAIGAAFLVGGEMRNSRDVFIAMALGLVVNLGFVLCQINGIRWWGESITPGGLFSNANMLASVCVVTLAGLLINLKGKWDWTALLIVPALATLYFTWSRASILSLMALCGLWLWRRNWRYGFALAVVALISLPVLAHMRPETARQRYVIWSDTWQAVTPFGKGLGSFHQHYPVIASTQTVETKPENAHNDYLEVLFEAGWPGLVLFVALLGSLMQSRAKEAYPLVTILMEATVAFPLHMPATVVVFGLLAGMCARHRYYLRSEHTDGRSGTRLWVDDGRLSRAAVRVRHQPVDAGLSPQSGHRRAKRCQSGDKETAGSRPLEVQS